VAIILQKPGASTAGAAAPIRASTVCVTARAPLSQASAASTGISAHIACTAQPK